MSFVAAGVGIAGLGFSAYQTIHGASEAKKAQNALKSQQTPTYTPNKSILDYYQEAKNRYQTSPYNSLQYQVSQNQINRNQGQAINNLQQGKSALGGIGAITQIGNDAQLKAGAAAEAQKNQAFNAYGKATGAEAADQSKQFQINQMLPYQQKRNLLAQQASGYTQLENAGISNLGNSIGALARVNWGSVFGDSGNTSIPPYASVNSTPVNQSGGNYSPASRYNTLNQQPLSLI